MNIAPVLKYPGSKWSMAKWICSFIDNIPHTTFLDLFFGSGAVFFNKWPAKVETVNDIDGNVINLFRIIRERPDDLARLAYFTPWSRDEYYQSYEATGEPLEDARRFLVRCWQAFGAKTSDRTGWKSNIEGMNGNIAAWHARLPQTILDITERLRKTQIENQDAMQLIERYALKTVLIYADPPYLLSTRSKRIYAHEMGSDEEHLRLLDLLDRHPGPALVSSYENDLYSDRLKHWQKETKVSKDEKAQKRTEVLWMNPECVRRQGRLFN